MCNIEVEIIPHNPWKVPGEYGVQVFVYPVPSLNRTVKVKRLVQFNHDCQVGKDQGIQSAGSGPQEEHVLVQVPEQLLAARQVVVVKL